jgi:hypothetical protein
MALGPEVINLVGTERIEEPCDLGGVGQIAMVKQKSGSEHMRIVVEVVDPAGIERGGAADDAVNLVSLREKEFGEVGTVLSCDSGDQCFFHDVDIYATG